jgi:hypothetical protein
MYLKLNDKLKNFDHGKPRSSNGIDVRKPRDEKVPIFLYIKLFLYVVNYISSSIILFDPRKRQIAN